MAESGVIETQGVTPAFASNEARLLAGSLSRLGTAGLLQALQAGPPAHPRRPRGT